MKVHLQRFSYWSIDLKMFNCWYTYIWAYIHIQLIQHIQWYWYRCWYLLILGSKWLIKATIQLYQDKRFNLHLCCCLCSLHCVKHFIVYYSTLSYSSHIHTILYTYVYLFVVSLTLLHKSIYILSLKKDLKKSRIKSQTQKCLHNIWSQWQHIKVIQIKVAGKKSLFSLWPRMRLHWIRWIFALQMKAREINKLRSTQYTN